MTSKRPTGVICKRCGSSCIPDPFDPSFSLCYGYRKVPTSSNPIPCNSVWDFVNFLSTQDCPAPKGLD